MRIIAGTARGRPLRSPRGLTTRPTSDRVRQATFNALESRGLVTGAAVADLYCGSGAMALEALSRGADRAVLVDRERDAVEVARANADALGFGERVQVIRDDVDRWLDHTARTAAWGVLDLVIADPPYRFSGWPALLARLAGRAAVVVAESGDPFEVPPGWVILRRQSYGATVITVLEAEGQPR